MATMVGKQSDLISALCAEIELDFDATEAYEAAIQRLDDALDKERLLEFRDDHVRHVTELSEFVLDFGGTPPTKGDAKAILTKGKVVILGLGGDKGILEAMKSNEEDTNAAYERLCARSDVPGNLLLTLQRALSDERRHRAYFEQRLASPTRSRTSLPSHP